MTVRIEISPRQQRDLAQIREVARTMHAGDDLEIDDDAMITPTPEGCWVAAWVFLPKIVIDNLDDA